MPVHCTEHQDAFFTNSRMLARDNTINIAPISVSGLVYLQIVILIVALYIKMEGER